jgi:hypothetical protein
LKEHVERLLKTGEGFPVALGCCGDSSGLHNKFPLSTLKTNGTGNRYTGHDSSVPFSFYSKRVFNFSIVRDAPQLASKQHSLAAGTKKFLKWAFLLENRS